MAIYTCEPDEQHEAILLMTGTPDELQPQSDGFVDIVAGFTVTKVTPGGQHDGNSAHVITLADDMGKREIGRLIVRNDVGYKEECLAWERCFEFTDDMRNFIDDYEATKAEAESKAIAEITLDFCWENYPSVAYGMAATAAEYGVSITKVSENGGGGWPEIKVVGLREKVVRLLKEGWQYSDELIAEELG